MAVLKKLADKDEVDATIADLQDQINAIEGIDGSGFVTPTQMDDAIDDALVDAANDATTKANAAQAAAATDATTKANAAQAAAVTETAEQIDTHNNDPNAHGLDIANVATQADLDALASAFDPGRVLEPVRVVSLEDVDVATGGLLTVDEVVLEEDNRVLLVAQSDAAENGPWRAHSGAWTRPTDFDTSGEALSGSMVLVSEGTDENKATSYFLNTTGSITLGTTDLTWVPVNRPGNYDVAPPLTRDGNTFTLGQESVTDVHVAAGNKDGAAGTYSLRRLGTTPGMALPGDHVSVTDARPPTSHATSHQTGGSDALNPANMGIAATHVGTSAITGVTGSTVQAMLSSLQSNITAATAAAGGKLHFVSTATAYTAAPGDCVLVDASGGTVVVTLPAVANDRAPIWVKKIDATANVVNVVPPSGVQVDLTLNGVTSLTHRRQVRMFGSNANAWYIAGAYDPPGMFARLDQTNDFAGNILSGYSLDFTSIGTVSALTVDFATHRGKDIGITTNTTTATTVAVTFPNTLPKGAMGAFTQEGSSPLVFAAATGAAVRHYASHNRTAGQFATVFWKCRFNGSGTQADILLSGQTAAAP